MQTECVQQSQGAHFVCHKGWCWQLLHIENVSAKNKIAVIFHISFIRWLFNNFLKGATEQWEAATVKF